MKSLFIFEGPDGCGKSTQVKMLEKKLTALGKKVKTTREPGGTPLGEKIREILLNDKDIIVSKETEAYLFAASRRAHNEQIKEWIEDGYTVICDRHLMSSMVFQQSEELNANTIYNLNKISMKPIYNDGPYSDINKEVLFFNINLETYKKRNSDRINSIGLDKVESRYIDSKSITNLLDNYKNIASSHIDCIVIDANRSIEEIHQTIIDLL